MELRVEDCPNQSVCGVAYRLEPTAEFELIRSGQAPISVTRQVAAAMMLMSRGCPQAVASFGLDEQIGSLLSQLSALREQVAEYEGSYIAPDGVEAVSYSVKRPGRTVATPEGKVYTENEYWYNKLMSQRAIFAPAERRRLVKVIHLSRDDDPRNQEGRRGVARRNQLKQIATQLRIAQSAIAKAQALAVQPFEIDH